MKDIENYEGLYAITEDGKVWSYRRNRFLAPRIFKTGYVYVALCKNGIPKQFSIHRLVAKEFIPNPNNWPQVNHKDEDPTNNSVENLEWCTQKYNNNYGSHNEKLSVMAKIREDRKRTN